MAPTDSRLRPDQRALEVGDLELATPEKMRLEEKQRAARRTRKVAAHFGFSALFSPRVATKPACKGIGRLPAVLLRGRPLAPVSAQPGMRICLTECSPRGMVFVACSIILHEASRCCLSL